MGKAELKQLMEMGIPGGRARAALMRAKDDVMVAAERVFAGEFDDIPSDDEGEDVPQPKGKDVASRVADITVISDGGEDEDMDSDDGDGMEDDDDDDEEGDFGFDESDDEDNRLLSDPYAGIFFSKDRTETIIENVEKPEYFKVSSGFLDDTELGRGIKASGKAEEEMLVKLLGNGEWMSGCPEGSEQSHLFQLYDKLSRDPVACSNNCGYEFHRKKSDFFALFSTFPTYLAYVASIINPSCPSCLHLTCLACGQKSDQSKNIDAWARSGGSGTATPTEKGKWKGKDKGRGATVDEVELDQLLHCVDIQGAILGVGLFMIESASSTKKKSISPATTPPAKRRRTSGMGESDDDEADAMVALGGKKGARAAAGTGYSGGLTEDRSGQLKAEKAQIASDTAMATLFSQVQVYLPQLNRLSGSRTSDHLVHPTALAHLRRRSGFVGDLLRNDSLLDMSNRGGLYRSLFDWLEVISSHEALASMLAMPQMRPSSTKPSPTHPDQLSVTYEGSPSPRELLEYIVIQAQAAMKGLTSTMGGGEKVKAVKEMTEDELRVTVEESKRAEEERREELKSDENQVLREFCNRIIASAATIDRRLIDTKGKDFVVRMQNSLPKLPEKTEGDMTLGSGATGEAIIKIYEEWAMKARFQYADLTDPNDTTGASYRHAYNANILALESQNAPKRSLAIAKELAILTTSLPVAWHSTIFLRVDESRVDCIKAMIVGPEGTPYENGCFIFDIFLPLEYNQKCPVVKSMTTYGGRYRYNPNLYADGKVCLSLLGTWQGPGWISGQSTLLQVLISIQSLIMCEEPYLNEPAWSTSGGTRESKTYSANVRRMVVVDAMAENIRDPPYPFENEIRTHFRLKAPSIREQLKKWEKIDDGRATMGDPHGAALALGDASGSGTPFVKAANALRRLLDGLEGKDMGPAPVPTAVTVPAQSSVAVVDDEDEDEGGEEEDEDEDEGEGEEWDDID